MLGGHFGHLSAVSTFAHVQTFDHRFVCLFLYADVRRVSVGFSYPYVRYYVPNPDSTAGGKRQGAAGIQTAAASGPAEEGTTDTGCTRVG